MCQQAGKGTAELHVGAAVTSLHLHVILIWVLQLKKKIKEREREREVEKMTSAVLDYC